ncbi:SPOSA6832_03731 [Sporobolomyces salmonicolor]|uniref:SPOSA6832_03731-mRNA-1:cds n=1 Tax=Sporidiobolus salmonicolor TaxID=5005 RepID=A0A0D6EQ50_SPOSA|nr:SPOSA6832_03731 [Sporobolomyces salmonicolor]
MSAPLSAAQRLQQAHESAHGTSTNGAAAVDPTVDPFPPFVSSEDPFPVAPLSSSAAPKKPKQPASVDVSDESAFPSLGGGPAKPKPSWGAGGAAAALRVKQGGGAPPAPAAAEGRDASPAPSSTLSRASTPALGVAGGVDFASLTLQLPTSSIHISAPPAPRGAPRPFSNDPRLRSGEPTTLGEVLKEVMRRHEGVSLEAGSSRNSTTFLVKAKGKDAAQRAERAKTELLGWLEKKVTEQVEVPASLRAVIIGAKGRTLKAITDSTGCSIQIPRDDELSTAPTSPSDDDESGPLISISLTGPSSAVSSAQAQILAIVRERTSKTTVSLPGVPSEFWSLLNGVKGERVKKIVERTLGEEEKEQVQVFVPRKWAGKRGVDVSEDIGEEEKEAREKEKAVQVSGDKEAVKKVVDAIESEIAELRATVRPVIFSLPKRQHRFLVGGAIADQILGETGCAVEIPSAENPSEDVVVRGPARETIKAMQMVMDLASATPVEQLDLLTAHRGTHDPRLYARNLARYLLVKSKLRPIASASSTTIYLPRPASITPSSANAFLEIVGSSAEAAAGVAQARQAVIGEVRKLPPSVFETVEIEELVHRHLIGKRGAKIRGIEKERKVEVVFPKEGEGREVLLVYVGEDAAGARAALEDVRTSLLALASDFADLTTSTLTIPSSLHGAIIGQGGTTLNAVIGEDKLVHVQFGSTGAEGEVSVRGPKDEVERVKGEIERIAEAARNEEIVNSHVSRELASFSRGLPSKPTSGRKVLVMGSRLTLGSLPLSQLVEFDIETVHVRHIVGKAGSGVNKLREDLGVRVDFVELPAAAGKKGKQSRVTIKGRKENAEEANKRIKALVEKIVSQVVVKEERGRWKTDELDGIVVQADEVTLTIPLPASLDRGSLIGKQGTYLKRLEEKYKVRINFPRDGRKPSTAAPEDDAPSSSSSNEIVIRGPSKGAQAAKGELVALIEYEKEHGNTVAFSVPVKALPRILGRGGAQVNQIKDDTGVASVDVDQESPEATTATVTLRGTKSAIKKAREAVEAIAKEVQDEARIELEVPKEFHTTLIGSGGSNIRDLIARCGGPSAARASGNMVRFPRQGEASDKVIITAPSPVASKIRAALEAEVASLASRVVWGVVVPQGNHAAVIGKGAQALQELQRKHGVKVFMPGWNDYAQAGEVENKDELADANEKEIVKVVGPKEAALAAAEDLKAVTGRGGPGGAGAGASAAAHSVKVLVPKKHHASVAQGGRFFRSLPSGTRVSHEGIKPPSSTLKAKKPPVSARSANGSAAARIDDDSNGFEAEAAEQVEFQLVPLHEGSEANGASDEDEIPWVVESASAEDAEKIADEIRKSVLRAKEATHVGWVTVPRGLMPRIVGRGGAGLDRLRSTGVEVEVVGKRDANQLTLTGSPNAIDAAHKIIRDLNAPRRRERDEY